MSQKVRRLFRYLILLFPFALVLFEVFRTGTTDFSLLESIYSTLINNSIFEDIYLFMGDYIPNTTITLIVFGNFVVYLYYEIIDIFFDVLMLLPRTLDKMFDKLGRDH